MGARDGGKENERRGERGDCCWDEKEKGGREQGREKPETTTWEKRSILLGNQGRNYRGTGLLPASAQPAFLHIPGPSDQG